MNAMLQRQIEEASLNAWPALQQILLDGWILRFSNGYTRRANSVNPLFISTLDVHKKVETCEGFYEEKGLPPIFRITPFSTPPDLDQVLASRHYDKSDLTLVLYLDLEQWKPSPASGQLREESLNDWMNVFCQLSGYSPDERQTHWRILQAILARRYLASLVVSGQAVSCGMGVLERSFLGLFDIVTDPQHRNQGFGTALVFSILRRAQESGARHAYLQVTSRNIPARQLYAKLGFQEAYRYWYRVPKNQEKER
jgi:GNAT superfamily N-acetyltransferase